MGDLCAMLDERATWGPAEDAGVEVTVRRLDRVGGNKGFKLALNVERALALPSRALLTFGGAWSNHLHATAWAGKAAGVRTVGIVRGGEVETVTMRECREAGMELVPVSRAEYAERGEEAYLAGLRNRFGRPWVVPEGGANVLGLQGCQGILRADEAWDAVVVAAGTGTTLGGMALRTGGAAPLVAVSALKGVDHRPAVERLLHWSVGDAEWAAEMLEGVTWWTDAHAGGFGKLDERVRADWAEWEGQTQIPLDRVYTAKLISRLKTELARPESERHTGMRRGCRVLVIHTGGLQGNRSDGGGGGVTLA